jgi:hypothetical protein
MNFREAKKMNNSKYYAVLVYMLYPGPEILPIHLIRAVFQNISLFIAY